MSSVTLDLVPPVAKLRFESREVGANEIRDLVSAVDSLGDDNSIRVIVVSASGGWADSVLESASAARDAGVLSDPFGVLASLPKPVICVAGGELCGGSIALALAADIRLADEGATFVFDETAHGVVPIGGATQRLVRLVGRGNALDLILSGRSIDAAEALRIGLVSEVAADAHQRADEIAARIAERGPIAVAYAKEAVTRGAEMPLEQALRYETDLTMILQTTEDRDEGVKAFLEKQKPEFKGR